MLIDANSLLYRAYFALPSLTNSSGQPTGAVYGFVNMLIKLREDYPTEYIVAAFDAPGPTLRSERYQEYKAHRPKMPPELRDQFAIARTILTAMDIPQVELPGYEADDLVATLAKRAEVQGMFSWIISGDKDILQVVDDKIHVIMTQKGISQTTVYDIAKVVERFKSPPRALADIKGLMGDPSDNIPGVPGIGEKTAVDLISRFGSLEGVYENLDQVANRFQTKLEEHKEQALLSRELAIIDKKVPLETPWPPIKPNQDDQEVGRLFRELEFHTLLDRLNLEEKRQGQPAAVTIITSEEVLADLLKGQDLALALLGDGAMALGREERSYYLPKPLVPLAWKFLKQTLGDEDVRLVVDDAKAFFKKALELNTVLRGDIDSCQLAAYLLKPGSSTSLSSMVRNWLGEELVELPNQDKEQYQAAHVALLPELWTKLSVDMEDADLRELYSTIELPLSKVLALMEHTGIAVDAQELDKIGGELAGRINKLQEDIWAQAGEPFNINSPKQLGEVLFEKLGLPPAKKTKTGYSTDAEVLESLADSHEIIPLLMDFRTLVKLQSTYVDGLRAVRDATTGRIYTTFNQLITATGRLSSTEPNLQNIPIRVEEGRRIRKAFVPGEGYELLLAGDYSQIELRLLAHISGDENLVDSFLKGEDIHRRTAAEIFGVEPGEVTSAQRYGAKAVNFGLVYGQTDFGLSRALGISRKEAQKYIETYFLRYPGVKRYMENVVAEARQLGYVTTLFHRRRYLPEITSSNFQRRSFAERTAINTPIQGSAADLMKLAMVEVSRRLAQEKLQSRMLLTVHDELVVETTQAELAVAARLLKEAMEGVVSLQVPLVVDLRQGKNWYVMDEMNLD